MNRNFEIILQEFYIEQGNDILKYNLLSEEEKSMFTKSVVTQIVKSIEDKAYQTDNVLINKSKGDITKLENYHYIKESLNLLNNMQASADFKIPYLDILNSAHENLIEYSKEFERGYKLRNDVVQILYAQLVIAEIQSLSFLIATSMDYVKDPFGNYEANLRYNLDKLNKYPTVNIECLEKFNLMARNGELSHFFNKVYTDKKLSEESLFVAALEIAGESVGLFGRILYAIVKLIPSIPEILRMFVSMSLFTRVSISDYLKLQAHFIELNIERQRNLQKPNKQVIKRQERVMKNLIKLSEFIDIDQKNASKQAKIQIEKENKNISNSIKKDSNNVGSSRNNNVEEIIL